MFKNLLVVDSNSDWIGAVDVKPHDVIYCVPILTASFPAPGLATNHIAMKSMVGWGITPTAPYVIGDTGVITSLVNRDEGGLINKTYSLNQSLDHADAFSKAINMLYEDFLDLWVCMRRHYKFYVVKPENF